jgi:hypothetical protein
LPGALAAILLMATASLQAAWPEIRFSAERVARDGLEIRSVEGNVDGAGTLRVSAETADLDYWPGRLRGLSVQCPLFPAGSAGMCAGGSWRVELPGLHRDREFSPVTGAIEGLVSDRGKVELHGILSVEGLEARFGVARTGDDLQATLSWDDQALLPLRTLRSAPPGADWITRGSSDGRLGLAVANSQTPTVDFSFRLNDLSFDSPDGLYAGEGLQLETGGTVRLGDEISGQLSGQVTGGELLLGDFYRDFSDAAMAFETRPFLGPFALRLEAIRLTDRSAFDLQGEARLELGEDETPLSFTISNLQLNFPGAYKRYVESVAAIFALDGLELTGGVSWSGTWEDGAFQSGELLVNDLTVVDVKRERFAVTGLEARMRPGDHEFDSRLTWRGLVLGPVNLGAAEVGLDSAPGRFALSRPLELDVLGGQLVLRELAIDLPRGVGNVEGDVDITLQAEMRRMDMELLTRALGWPTFDGQISGVIPAVSLDDGVLDVDGEILFQVFDGEIALSNLRVERPFGVLPSLAADIDIYDLDLEQVTHTFSFGQIGGRLDGYVHDLRMLDWKPVAFDAWLGTPERQEQSNDISRQAVNHLTTLGGGSATTALTGPIMRMFNNFAYRRLGLGCRLQNNICELRGISEDDSSVLIMEGAGIPKIMIKAFNRRLDFPQLVAGLTAVSGDEKIRVGD